jgi:CheY-like chemotaxis protein
MGALGASGAVAKQGAESDASGRGLILLVDDEQSIARAYARTLGAAGFTVEIAFDGKEAAAAAKERNFDVIVSDIAMPEMNGLELLRAVREHDLDVPFVLMTGGPGVDSAVRAVEYGALRYLIKPVSTAELEEVVARAVRLHQMARIKREALELFRLDGKHLGDRAGLEARFASALGSLWIAYQPIVSWSRRSTATRSRPCARRPICSRRPSGWDVSRSSGARCAIASPTPWT